MAAFYNNTEKVSVEVEELVPCFWSSQNILSKEISRHRDKPYGIKALQRGCRGRRLLVDFDTLPAHIREALPDPRKIDHNFEPFYKTNGDAVRFYTSFRRPDGSALLDGEQQRYITNASVLAAAIAFRETVITERIKLGISLKGITNMLCEECKSFKAYQEKRNLPVHNLPGTYIHFNEALKGFETGFKYEDAEWPFNFLHIVKDVEGKRKINALKVDDEVNGVLNGLFANQRHKPTIIEIHRAYEAFLGGYAEIYNEDSGEVYNPKGFPQLSESTIKNWLTKYENKVATWKERSGDRQKYMGLFKPYHQLERPAFAGSIISVDDRNPPFKDLSGNRVWFYNGLDVASGCITTFVHGKTKEGIITNFYRQMVRNYTQWGVNLPHELEAESALNSSFTKTFLQEGAMFQEVRIEANNARGKRIERDNGILRYNIEKKREGWLARPNAKSESNQAGSEKVPQIPYDQIVENAIQDIFELNNSPHMEDEGKTRWEYFMDNQHPELKPTNWPAILPHLGFRTESSCTGGYIKLQGKARAIAQNGKICTGDSLISALKAIEGKELEIFWLDGNDGKVLKALAYHNGRLICEVQEMPTYNRATIERTAKDEAARELQSAYVATVEGFIRKQQKNLQRINIIHQPKPEPKRPFFIPGMEAKKRYTPEPEPAQIIATTEPEDYELPTPNVDWRQSFFK